VRPAGPSVPLSAGLAFVCGTLVALQSKINGELATRSGAPAWAALVSFGSGLVLVTVLVLATPRIRRASRAALTDRLPWWTYLGGLCGATLVAVAAVAVPRIGVATFTVGVVAGQAIAALLVDRSPLTPGEPRPLSFWRVAGAGLVILAVVVIRLGHDSGSVSAGLVLLLLTISAVAGAGTAVQQALNGRVQRATGEPLVATLGNFLVGTAALVLLFLGVTLAGAGPDRHWPGGPELYVGGSLGVVFIAVAAWTVRGLGVLRLGLLTVAGQLAGGVLIDALSPAATGGVDAATIAGVLLTLVGVALAGHTPAADRPRVGPGAPADAPVGRMTP
jgi:bacterial/archaeal transporter family-2 protein